MTNSSLRVIPRRARTLFVRLPLLLAFMVASTTLLAAQGETQGPPGAEGYVIEAGRESEVLALFEPLTLPGEVAEGWTLANLGIERSHIVCDMRGPDGRSAQVLLVPKGTRSNAPLQTTSFAVVAGEGDLAPPLSVVEAIHEVVVRNDTSRFYRIEVTRLLATGQNAGLIDARWLVDGLAWSGIALLLLLVLTFTHLRRERWTVAALVLGALVTGAVLRLLMSENVAMGAWPFSRWNSVTLSIGNGPGLALLSERLDASWTRHELATGITFAFALVTPLALFVHARYLLNDAWVAVAAAWMIALLPHHIRFSHSEVAFIPSLVLGAMLFATCHMGLRERSLGIRALAWIALPFISTYTYSARPLNVVFFPLVIWMTFGLDHAGVPLRRKLWVVALTSGGFAHSLITSFIHYSPNVEEGLGSTVVFQGLAVLTRQPQLFIPLNFSVTPVIVAALALFGLFHAWQSGRRRMAAFLFVWFWGFVVLHSYVIPSQVAMQARYYLHMVVPMTFAAALGLVAMSERAPRWATWGAIVTLALSPLIHRDFIRDVHFADTDEYAFVVEIADLVPTGCTVLEYLGHAPEAPPDSTLDPLIDSRIRFAAEQYNRGNHEIRATVVPVGAPRGETGPISDAALEVLRNPPDCLLVYEGLSCWGQKEPDEPIAPACALLRERVNLTPLATRATRSRMLDEAAAPGVHLQDVPMQYTLYSVVRDAQPAGDPRPQEQPPLPWPLRVIR